MAKLSWNKTKIFTFPFCWKVTNLILICFTINCFYKSSFWYNLPYSRTKKRKRHIYMLHVICYMLYVIYYIFNRICITYYRFSNKFITADHLIILKELYLFTWVQWQIQDKNERLKYWENYYHLDVNLKCYITVTSRKASMFYSWLVLLMTKNSTQSSLVRFAKQSGHNVSNHWQLPRACEIFHNWL